MTEQNYNTCIDLLQDRFGKVDVIINKYVDNLLNMERVKNSSYLSELRKLHDMCEINIRSLRNLCITTSTQIEKAVVNLATVFSIQATKLNFMRPKK